MDGIRLRIKVILTERRFTKDTTAFGGGERLQVRITAQLSGRN
jgi:hypothetical protein